MLGFVQSWFTPGANPIGVDFGSDGLRMAQVEAVGPAGIGPSDFKLVAAARADVPSHVRHDPPARLAFFADTLRDLWSQGNFRGRKAVLSLPAAAMNIQHLRVPRMDEDALKKALPWEARGKLPYDPSHALIRHILAGEIHQDGEQKCEVILLAAQREFVNGLLSAAARARLDVVGMNVEPRAVVDCFCHVYRRKVDAEVTQLFVDIGCTASRAYVARGQQVLFARVVPIGGDHFTRAVASALKIGFEDAKALRIKRCQALAAPQVAEAAAARGATTLPALAEAATPIGLATFAAPPGGSCGQGDSDTVFQACREPAARLVEELALCRRYHEATFPSLPINRLVFIGGEARDRSLCQEVVRGLELAAQVGDPMVRMARTTDVGPETGIDRRQPQPDWAVALGLSMGPVHESVAENAAARAR